MVARIEGADHLYMILTMLRPQEAEGVEMTFDLDTHAILQDLKEPVVEEGTWSMLQQEVC